MLGKGFITNIKNNVSISNTSAAILLYLVKRREAGVFNEISFENVKWYKDNGNEQRSRYYTKIRRFLNNPDAIPTKKKLGVRLAPDSSSFRIISEEEAFELAGIRIKFPAGGIAPSVDRDNTGTSESITGINSGKKEGQDGRSVEYRLISAADPEPLYYINGSRDDTFRRIDEKFAGGAPAVFLYGVGGIGKSVAAIQYARERKKEYDSISYYTFDRRTRADGLPREIKIRSLVCDKIILDGFSDEQFALANSESKTDLFSSKLRAMKKTRGKGLIIVDNYDCEKDEDLLDFINTRTYKVIFTTRYMLPDLRHYYIDVPSMTKPELIKLFSDKAQTTVSGENERYVSELIDKVDSNTIAVEILAYIFSDSLEKSVASFSAGLKNNSVFSDKNILIRLSSADPYNSPIEIIKSLFSVAALSSEEKNILVNMSVMRPSGVNVYEFCRYIGIKSKSYIRVLDRKSWLTYNADADMLTMEAVVREAVVAQITPDTNNCSRLVESADAIRRSADKLFSENNWADALKDYITSYTWLSQINGVFQSLICDLQIRIARCYYELGRYCDACDYYDIVFHNYISGDINISSGELPELRRYGFCLVNGIERFNEAYILRKKLVEAAEQRYGKNSREILCFYEDLANSASLIGENDKAPKIRKNPDLQNSNEKHF